MVVGPHATLGTIGGGQLEYMVIDAARAMLARGEDAQTLDIPLGPEIGQCCGGRTAAVGGAARTPTAGRRCAPRPRRSGRALPEVHVFGAGHVGRALAAALALLPVRPVLVDQRAEELRLAPAGIDAVLTPLPEEVVRRRAAGRGLRGADPRPRARLPDRARGAGARRRGLRRDDRLADQAGVVPERWLRREARARSIRRRWSARSARPGGRTSGRR